MRSLIGPKKHTTEKGIAYTSYAHKVKKEGEMVTAKFSSREEAYNALMQSIIDVVLANPDKDIVWRHFPEVSEDIEYGPWGLTSTWYTCYARFALE